MENNKIINNNTRINSCVLTTINLLLSHSVYISNAASYEKKPKIINVNKWEKPLKAVREFQKVAGYKIKIKNYSILGE